MFPIDIHSLMAAFIKPGSLQEVQERVRLELLRQAELAHLQMQMSSCSPIEVVFEGRQQDMDEHLHRLESYMEELRVPIQKEASSG